MDICIIVSVETGLYKEVQQSKITLVSLDGVIIGDFYYPLFFSTLSNFSIMKILFKNEKTEG